MCLHTNFLFKGSLLLFVNCIQTAVIQLMLLLYEFIVSLQYYIREGFSRKGIPHICHGHKDGVRGEKICHVEKFQISVHDR